VEKIPDEALVIRGGRNLPEDIRRGTGTHPSGITGISVECAVGIPLYELAKSIPHGQIGRTKVAKIRQQGGDVTDLDGFPTGGLLEEEGHKE
jgi:hypothetical protein